MTHGQSKTPRLACCGALAGVALVLWAGTSWALAYWATHPFRLPVPDKPPADLRPCLDVSFRTSDGITLSGWYFPTPGARAALILCHGHQFNRVQMMDTMRALRSDQFSFLLFDFRRSGRSGGDLCTVGLREVRDLRAATDWLCSSAGFGPGQIGVFGLSMGGAAAIMAAADDRRIGAVATQGAYATLDRAVAQRGRFLVGVLGPLVSGPATAMGQRWLGADPASVSPMAAISRVSPRPVLICHGKWDTFVSPDDAHLLYRAAREPKDLRILEGSWHLSVAASQREPYHRLLRSFFAQSLVTSPAGPAEGPEGSPPTEMR